MLHGRDQKRKFLQPRAFHPTRIFGQKGIGLRSAKIATRSQNDLEKWLPTQ
jgi:hypothetical protein